MAKYTAPNQPFSWKQYSTQQHKNTRIYNDIFEEIKYNVDNIHSDIESCVAECITDCPNVCNTRYAELRQNANESQRVFRCPENYSTRRNGNCSGHYSSRFSGLESYRYSTYRNYANYGDCNTAMLYENLFRGNYTFLYRNLNISVCIFQNPSGCGGYECNPQYCSTDIPWVCDSAIGSDWFLNNMSDCKGVYYFLMENRRDIGGTRYDNHTPYCGGHHSNFNSSVEWDLGCSTVNNTFHQGVITPPPPSGYYSVNSIDHFQRNNTNFVGVYTTRHVKVNL